MNTNRTLEIVGAVTFWNCDKQNDLAAIKEGLDELGYGDCAPHARTAFAASKVALTESFGTADHIIRALDNNIGLAVYHETQGNDGNEYDLRCLVRIEADDEIAIELHGAAAGNGDIRDRIRERFTTALGQVCATAIGTALSKLTTKLAGLSLRPNGGVYWIPEYNRARFEKVAEVFEKAGKNGRTQVHMLQTARDDRAVRAVHRSLIKEVTDECTKIRDEIATRGDGITDRWRTSRESELEAMMTKLGSYESLMEESLVDLRKLVTDVKATVTLDAVSGSAAMMAASTADSLFG